MISSSHIGELINPKQSQQFGRCIYKFTVDQQTYWLKAHVQGCNLISEQGFLNELAVYQKIGIKVSQSLESHPIILLPFQIIKTHDLFDTKICALPEAILIHDAQGLFDPSPQLLNQAEIIHILFKSLDAVDVLHKINYLHGDLKVEHFRVLSGDSSCCLIDFEQTLAINTIDISEHTATPRYMAPELFHAAQKTVQTDIYALGIIWLEWLKQQRTQKKSYMDWAFLHCQQLKVTLPEQFYFMQTILEAMLAKNDHLRFENIYQIKQRLSEYV